MIGVGGCHCTEQIGIDRVILPALTKIWPWMNGRNAHLAHIPLNPFAIDMPRWSEQHR
jgi:hypothetical protein